MGDDIFCFWKIQFLNKSMRETKGKAEKYTKMPNKVWIDSEPHAVFPANNADRKRRRK